jgi:type IV pilus assembly protein PilV
MIRGAPNRQSGMTLIEVLAALVILAIGLIGVTSLQLNALRNVKVSGDVQAVTSGVNELVELMRLNGDNAPDYDGLTTSSCSNIQTLADEDFCRVVGLLAAELPASNVTLSVSSCAAVGAVCVIQAQWTPRQTYGLDGSAASQTYSMSVQL